MSRAPVRRAVTALALVAAAGGGLLAPGASAAPVPAAPAAARPPLPGEWWWSAMGIDELHRSGTGRGVSVAVIDGPIDPDVPELKGKVVSSESFCDEPNAYDDPVRLSPSATGRAAEHATSMAALIAGSGRGTGPGGRGIRGIAPDVTIRHYAVMYRDEDGEPDCFVHASGGQDVDQAMADAIWQAGEDGADVISISLVGNYDPDIVDGLYSAYRNDAIVVAGTPNDGADPQWPGLGNGVVLVNSVDERAKIPGFAVQDSPFIGLTAPGKDVMAASYDDSGWQSDAVASGSSIATALVSGGLAAIRSAHPDATAGQVLHAVKDNVGLREKEDGSGYETWFRRVGSDLPSVRSANAAYGWGVFDPADAVTVDPTTYPEDNPFVRDGAAADPTAEQIATVMGLSAASPPASGTPTSGASASASASSAPQAVAPSDDSGSSWPLLAGGALVLVAVVGGGVLLLRRRAAARPDPGATATTTTTEGAARAGGRSL